MNIDEILNSAAQPKSKLKTGRKLKRLTLMVIGVVLVAAVFIGLIVYQNRGGEGGRLSRALSSYFQLPNETPSVATVTDKAKLSTQMFFQQAQNGDKLLIYSKAHLIVLYRPSIKKVVDIAPISQ